VAVTIGAEVVISVLDDGPGMRPELIAAPFEPARRPRPSPTVSASVGNASSPGGGKRPGAGLGLSIAKGIVQAHGGRLELAELPEGTCFTVYLPVEAEVLEPVRVAEAAPRVPTREG
jgi:signal transduction histidine kinase